MRIGVCTSVSNLDMAASLGYDYTELPLNAFSSLDEGEFAEAARIVERCPVRCEAMNMFFPFGMRIVGSGADEGKTKEYILRMIGRARALGAGIVVIGSGGARRVLDGEDPEGDMSQFKDVLRRIGDEAAKAGMTAVLEPLNARETNLITSLSQGAMLVRAIGHPRVELLADFYHMRMEDEGMESVLEGRGILRHAHIANGKGRAFPAERAEDLYDEFFAHLASIGYRGSLSVEADPEGFEAGASRALGLMREISRDHGL